MKLRAIAASCALFCCEPTLPWDGSLTLHLQGAATGTYFGRVSATRNLQNNTGTISFSGTPDGSVSGINVAAQFSGPLRTDTPFSLLAGTVMLNNGQTFALKSDDPALAIALTSVSVLQDAQGAPSDTEQYEIHGSLAARFAGPSNETVILGSRF